MAVKAKGKPGRPANPANNPEKSSNVPPGHKPMMIHIPIKLHGAVKVTALATGSNISEVVRDVLRDWVKANKKKAIAYISGSSEDVDEDSDEVEAEVDESEDDEDEDEDDDE